MKKIGLLFATVIMMVMFAVSTNALSTTGQCGDNVYWTFDEVIGELIVSGEGDMYDFNDAINPAPWKNIYSDSIVSVKILDGVTIVGDNSFSWLKNLKNVDIANSITSIGTYAFAGSSVENIALSENLTLIEPSAFQACSALTVINLPDSLLKIGNYAFAGSGLVEVYIPDNVTMESTYEMPTSKIFYGCKNLKIVSLGKNITSCSFGMFGDCSSLESITILGDLTKVSGSAFYNCSSLGDIYFAGTEEKWNTIYFDIDNNDILNANIHFSHRCIDLEIDGYCDSCKVKIGSSINLPTEPDEPDVPDTPAEPDAPNEPCTCKCHGNIIQRIIFKITNFFQKLLGKNKVCACGVKH